MIQGKQLPKRTLKIPCFHEFKSQRQGYFQGTVAVSPEGIFLNISQGKFENTKCLQLISQFSQGNKLSNESVQPKEITIQRPICFQENKKQLMIIFNPYCNVRTLSKFADTIQEFLFSECGIPVLRVPCIQVQQQVSYYGQQLLAHCGTFNRTHNCAIKIYSNFQASSKEKNNQCNQNLKISIFDGNKEIQKSIDVSIGMQSRSFKWSDGDIFYFWKIGALIDFDSLIRKSFRISNKECTNQQNSSTNQAQNIKLTKTPQQNIENYKKKKIQLVNSQQSVQLNIDKPFQPIQEQNIAILKETENIENQNQESQIILNSQPIELQENYEKNKIQKCEIQLKIMRKQVNQFLKDLKSEVSQLKVQQNFVYEGIPIFKSYLQKEELGAKNELHQSSDLQVVSYGQSQFAQEKLVQQGKNKQHKNKNYQKQEQNLLIMQNQNENNQDASKIREKDKNVQQNQKQSSKNQQQSIKQIQKIEQENKDAQQNQHQTIKQVQQIEEKNKSAQQDQQKSTQNKNNKYVLKIQAKISNDLQKEQIQNRQNKNVNCQSIKAQIERSIPVQLAETLRKDMLSAMQQQNVQQQDCQDRQKIYKCKQEGVSKQCQIQSSLYSKISFQQNIQPRNLQFINASQRILEDNNNPRIEQQKVENIKQDNIKEQSQLHKFQRQNHQKECCQQQLELQQRGPQELESDKKDNQQRTEAKPSLGFKQYIQSSQKTLKNNKQSSAPDKLTHKQGQSLEKGSQQIIEEVVQQKQQEQQRIIKGHNQIQEQFAEGLILNFDQRCQDNEVNSAKNQIKPNLNYQQVNFNHDNQQMSFQNIVAVDQHENLQKGLKQKCIPQQNQEAQQILQNNAKVPEDKQQNQFSFQIEKNCQNRQTKQKQEQKQQSQQFFFFNQEKPFLIYLKQNDTRVNLSKNSYRNKAQEANQVGNIDSIIRKQTKPKQNVIQQSQQKQKLVQQSQLKQKIVQLSQINQKGIQQNQIRSNDNKQKLKITKVCQIKQQPIKIISKPLQPKQIVTRGKKHLSRNVEKPNRQRDIILLLSQSEDQQNPQKQAINVKGMHKSKHQSSKKRKINQILDKNQQPHLQKDQQNQPQIEKSSNLYFEKHEKSNKRLSLPKNTNGSFCAEKKLKQIQVGEIKQQNLQNNDYSRKNDEIQQLYNIYQNQNTQKFKSKKQNIKQQALKQQQIISQKLNKSCIDLQQQKTRRRYLTRSVKFLKQSSESQEQKRIVNQLQRSRQKHYKKADSNQKTTRQVRKTQGSNCQQNIYENIFKKRNKSVNKHQNKLNRKSQKIIQSQFSEGQESVSSESDIKIAQYNYYHHLLQPNKNQCVSLDYNANIKIHKIEKWHQNFESDNELITRNAIPFQLQHSIQLKSMLNNQKSRKSKSSEFICHTFDIHPNNDSMIIAHQNSTQCIYEFDMNKQSQVSRYHYLMHNQLSNSLTSVFDINCITDLKYHRKDRQTFLALTPNTFFIGDKRQKVASVELDVLKCYRSQAGFNKIAINSHNQHQVALASKYGSVRLYDVRKITRAKNKYNVSSRIANIQATTSNSGDLLLSYKNKIQILPTCDQLFEHNIRHKDRQQIHSLTMPRKIMRRYDPQELGKKVNLTPAHYNQDSSEIITTCGQDIVRWNTSKENFKYDKIPQLHRKGKIYYCNYFGPAFQEGESIIYGCDQGLMLTRLRK